MGTILERLEELGVEQDDFIALRYTDGADVWHINESHVEETVAETATAEVLAKLLASRIPVYGMHSDTYNILSEMRDQGLLDEYDREGWFAEYLKEKLQETIYDEEYSLEHETKQYDYKRGWCSISTAVRLRVGDLYEISERFEAYENVTADTVVSYFDVSVETDAGTLTLS